MTTLATRRSTRPLVGALLIAALALVGCMLERRLRLIG